MKWPPKIIILDERCCRKIHCFGQNAANKHENQFTLVFNDFRSAASLKNLPKWHLSRLMMLDGLFDTFCSSLTISRIPLKPVKAQKNHNILRISYFWRYVYKAWELRMRRKNGSNSNYALEIMFNFVKTETSTKPKQSK